MIKLEKTQTYGWKEAIRGMRNPMNSWEKSDSAPCVMIPCYKCTVGKKHAVSKCPDYVIGPNDHELMMKLVRGGSVHAKFRRMITVYVDITAPLYWWKEFDTYKIGTVANSCSTMHKIADKEFTLEDFSCEHLLGDDSDVYILTNTGDSYEDYGESPIEIMQDWIIAMLNKCRELYLDTKDKTYWWQMIQLLPSSYNQKRTVMMNYEVLAGIYPSRKNHKLDEWHDFCEWIEHLPYSEIIIGEEE
ncbi:MAG: hypothetical protein LIP10_03595 [Clostridiales bacterium]|nr:hypothetical protein [Clostridiales bacterium]